MSKKSSKCPNPIPNIIWDTAYVKIKLEIPSWYTISPKSAKMEWKCYFLVVLSLNTIKGDQILICN